MKFYVKKFVIFELVYYICSMEYTKKDLKPVTDYLKQEGHGSKKYLCEKIEITQSQLSFYLRFRTMSKEMFNKILMACK